MEFNTSFLIIEKLSLKKKNPTNIKNISQIQLPGLLYYKELCYYHLEDGLFLKKTMNIHKN